jgi:hypothetical protein
MGFMKTSASFTRYRIISEIPDGLWSELADRLRRNRFRDIDETADERSFGWVSYDNWLDPNFKEAPPQKGEYVAFQLRLDTRRVSPAVFKKHFQLALDEALAQAREQGRKFVSRDQKKELREQVALKLRARTLPVPAVFEVVWNTSTGHVYLGSTRQQIKNMFEDMFTLTFDLHLEPLTPFYLASALTPDDRMQVLERVEPTTFA